jgi:hypothetical protein
MEQMFQFVEEGPSFPSFLVQQIVLPIVAFLVVAFTPNVPSAFTFGQPNPTLENAWSTLITLIAAFCFALVARRMAPRLSRDGRWIWAIPFGLLTMALVSDSVRFGFKSTAADYFNPQMGEAGWVFVLVVIPTYACLAYSFGVSDRASRLTARLRITSS